LIVDGAARPSTGQAGSGGEKPLGIAERHIAVPECVLGRGWLTNDNTFWDEMMNIYAGNLPYSVTEDDLREAFAAFGEVANVQLITDKFSGQSKGFGFVEMPNNAEADEAIKSLNDTPLKGRDIKVNQAKPRGERPARRPRY
jgi:hypothetical protein